MPMRFTAAIPALLITALVTSSFPGAAAVGDGHHRGEQAQAHHGSDVREVTTLAGERSEPSGRGFIPPTGAEHPVVGPFNKPAQNWLPGHRGVDLATAPGREVWAPAAGTVTFVGTVVDRGVLVVLHPNGLRSSFEPIVSPLTQGQRVGQRQWLGTVPEVSEDPGHCVDTCLHWGVRLGSEYIDPTVLLGEPTIVLLPTG